MPDKIIKDERMWKVIRENKKAPLSPKEKKWLWRLCLTTPVATSYPSLFVSPVFAYHICSLRAVFCFLSLPLCRPCFVPPLSSLLCSYLFLGCCHTLIESITRALRPSARACSQLGSQRCRFSQKEPWVKHGGLSI